MPLSTTASVVVKFTSYINFVITTKSTHALIEQNWFNLCFWDRIKTITPCHSLMMNPAILYLVFAAIVAIDSQTAVSAQSEGTCQACNCQFNNVQVLSRLIELKIASGELYLLL